MDQGNDDVIVVEPPDPLTSMHPSRAKQRRVIGGDANTSSYIVPSSRSPSPNVPLPTIPTPPTSKEPTRYKNSQNIVFWFYYSGFINPLMGIHTTFEATGVSATSSNQDTGAAAVSAQNSQHLPKT